MPDRLPIPLSHVAALDLYFAEHRAKLLDIAAFLDRLDRASAKQSQEDFRLFAFHQALRILSDGEPQRARRILEVLSDPTIEPIATAPAKGAAGAWPGLAASAANRP